MPYYREKKIYSGKYLEVGVYPISKNEKKQSRKTKQKLSSVKQKNLNDKNAKMHLVRLINTNFTNNDLAVHLTYDDVNLPENEKEAKRDVTNYLRRIKHYRKKKGLPPLKYIAVIEDGQKGKRIHHHIIMDGKLDRDTVEELWGKGYANADRLKEDENGFEALGKYISKDPKGNKRWVQSKNLKQPKVSVNDSKYKSKRQVEELSKYPEDRETFEKLYKGYTFTKCSVSVNEVTGNIYLYIKMRKLKK